MRKPRYVQPNSLVEVTCKTILGKFLLRPSKRLNEILVGVLARAQKNFPVRLHAVVAVSNHLHMLLSVDDAQQLAGFMQYFNSNLARKVGRLHGWPASIWAQRYRHIVVSDEDAAQLGRLRYLLSHGCKEGLVQRPEDWPGVHSAEALMTGKALQGYWFDQTQVSAARRRGEEVDEYAFATEESVELVPLPCWAHLPSDVWRQHVRDMVRDIERETAARHHQEGSRPSGVQAVLEKDPHAQPEKLEHRPAPHFHAASQAVRQKLELAYRLVVFAFREASQRLRSGERDAAFPEGCFPPGLPFVEFASEVPPG